MAHDRLSQRGRYQAGRQPVAPQREVYLRFHGVTAEDVAAIVAGVNRDR